MCNCCFANERAKQQAEQVISEAQKEADGIVKEAENKIISMIDEYEILNYVYSGNQKEKWKGFDKQS